MKLLVTGGAGFIGSHFIRYILEKEEEIEVINVDCLTYAGQLSNLVEIEKNPRYIFVKADITDQEAMEQVFKEKIDYVINFAAESHVDRSILSADAFIKTNVLGTSILLELARRGKVTKYLQVSTDEVYGALGTDGFFTEDTPLAPNSPYSASKASGDLLVRAYHKTYGLPVNITRCSNNYGSHQLPEKLIPLMVCNAKEGKKLPVYGTGQNVRDWIHVTDHCKALVEVLFNGKPGEVYNIGGHAERTNLEIVEIILETLGRGKEYIEFVGDRLGHDFRYAIDPIKIKDDLGWEPCVKFEDGIKETIKWYIEHKEWWEEVRQRLASYYKELYE